MFAKTAIIIAAAAGLASALPTTTPPAVASRTVPRGELVATHSVVAGRGGALVFDPENVVAEIGDVVEFHFTPKNHSVVQSSFGEPCKPLGVDQGAQGFFSGFFPTPEGQNPDVFQIVVTDSNPIWYYCAQTTGNHCQNGMAGVINQNFNSPNTLSAYKANAALTGVSVIPPTIEGGAVIPNPNPNSGF